MSSLSSLQHLQRVAVLRAVHSVLAGADLQTSVSPSRDSAVFSVDVLLHLADAALQSASEATQLRCLRVLLLEVPNHPLDFDSSLRMCSTLRALTVRFDVFPAVQQAVKLLLAVLGSSAAAPSPRHSLLPPRIAAPSVTNTRFDSECGTRIFQGPSWDALRVCNSAFMIDTSTIPYSALGHAFESLHTATASTIEDDPEFGSHLLQHLPDDSELIELERKWLHFAPPGRAHAQARGASSSCPRAAPQGHPLQELLLPHAALAKLMQCLTTSKSESEATLKASSIMAKVLADRCVFDPSHGWLQCRRACMKSWPAVSSPRAAASICCTTAPLI
jgi:hypothetical protein